jgi:hypothetical protein
MTPDDPPPAITLPAAAVIQLADLLTELDEFLRSGGGVAEHLALFLAHHGHTHPGFAACNLIDEASFTAAHLRKLTHGIPRTTAAYAHLADYPGEEPHPSS